MDRDYSISRNEAKVAPSENEQFIDNYTEKGNSVSQVKCVENDRVDASLLSTMKID